MLDLWCARRPALHCTAAILAIDLSAAYDLCDHGVMLQRCRLLNLDPGTLLWLKSFLNQRYQQVEINGAMSPPLATGDYGVVQGAPSSGQLFNIYINTLPTVVNQGCPATLPHHSTHKQYVDDGSVVVRGRTEEELKKNIK